MFKYENTGIFIGALQLFSESFKSWDQDERLKFFMYDVKLQNKTIFYPYVA